MRVVERLVIRMVSGWEMRSSVVQEKSVVKPKRRAKVVALAFDIVCDAPIRSSMFIE
jgi:hypothetical protein